MTKVPSLDYKEILSALQRDGWSVIRQKGSHIRLKKPFPDHDLKLTIPAHKPVKRSTLSHIIKQARRLAVLLDGLLIAWGIHCWLRRKLHRRHVLEKCPRAGPCQG